MISLIRKENGTLIEHSYGAFLVCDVSERDIANLKSYFCGYSLNMCTPHINDKLLPQNLSAYTDENITEICDRHVIQKTTIERLLSLEPQIDEKYGLPALVKKFNSCATIPTIEELVRIYLVKEELDKLNPKGIVFSKAFNRERVASLSLYSNPFYFYAITNSTLTIEGLSSNCVTFPIIRYV